MEEEQNQADKDILIANFQSLSAVNYKDATWTLAAFLRSGDIYYEFAQKLVKAAEYSVCQRDSGGRFWTMS